MVASMDENRFNGFHNIVMLRELAEKPLKRFPKTQPPTDPKLKLGENEKLSFYAGSEAEACIFRH